MSGVQGRRDCFPEQTEKARIAINFCWVPIWRRRRRRKKHGLQYVFQTHFLFIHIMLLSEWRRTVKPKQGKVMIPSTSQKSQKCSSSLTLSQCLASRHMDMWQSARRFQCRLHRHGGIWKKKREEKKWSTAELSAANKGLDLSLFFCIKGLKALAWPTNETVRTLR